MVERSAFDAWAEQERQRRAKLARKTTRRSAPKRKVVLAWRVRAKKTAVAAVLSRIAIAAAVATIAEFGQRRPVRPASGAKATCAEATCQP